MGEFEKAKWPKQFIGAAIIGISIAAMGCLPYAYLFFGMLSVCFWFEVGLCAVSGIWFGAWGVLAASVGSMVASLTRIQYNSPYALPISMLFSYGAFFQALISAWAFRHFKGDPRITTSEDAWLFVVFGIFLGGIAHTLVVRSTLVIRSDLRYVMFYWFLPNAVPSFILGFPLLLLGSKIVIRNGAYCKGWFS